MSCNADTTKQCGAGGCGGAAAVGGTTVAGTAEYTDKAGVLGAVKEYYGEVLQSTKDLKTSACTACGAPPAAVRAALRRVPAEVLAKFYGCGNPLPRNIEGLSVLDLGCGSGRDCYVAAQFVGPAGRVTGIDMTEEQLGTARGAAAEFAAANPEAGQVTFLQGFIEDIGGAGVEAQSIDMVISNCVVNLSPSKQLVLQGAFEALRKGGEMHFSDVYCDRRMSDEARRDKLLLGECLSGALYTRDFEVMARRAGFVVRRLSAAPIEVHDAGLRGVLGNAAFESVTYRLFKLEGSDETEEDYGDFATYLGTIAEQPHGYALDEATVFEAHRPTRVSRNTALILQQSGALARHFRVAEGGARHFGPFCAAPTVVARVDTTSGGASSSCC